MLSRLWLVFLVFLIVDVACLASAAVIMLHKTSVICDIEVVAVIVCRRAVATVTVLLLF